MTLKIQLLPIFTPTPGAVALLATLLGATATLAAPPVVGPDIALDAPVQAPSRVGNGLAFARGVSGGGVSFVAWVDTRVSGGPRRVWATRLDALGQPLDKPFLELGDGNGLGVAFGPKVAYDGTNFVAVWVDPAQTNVVFRRVSVQGALVDAAPRSVQTQAAGGLNAPNIASDGAGMTLMTWVRWLTASSYTLESKRLDGTGTILDAAALTLGATASTEAPAVAWDGTQFVTFFLTGTNANYTLSTRRVSRAGAVTGAAPTSLFTLGSNYASLTVACGPSNCLLAWPNAGAAVVGARVASSVLVDAAPVTLVSHATRTMGAPWLAFDGTRYWLSSHSNGPGSFNEYDYLTRLDQTAASLGVTETIGTWDNNGFVGPTGTFMLLYGGTLKVSRVDTAGVQLDVPPVQLDWSANDQRTAQLAFGQGVVLVAWVDAREASDTVLARRFTPAGVPLDAQTLRLAALSPPVNGNELDGVVFDGQNFVVGWRDAMAVHLSRVSPAGALLDPVGGVAVTAATAGHPRLVSDGQQTWVTWEQAGLNSDVLGLRFSRAGTVLDNPPLVFAGLAANEHTPSLCFDGTRAWAGWYTDSPASYRVSRLSALGVPLDPGGVAIAGASTSAELVSGPACAATWSPSLSQARLTRVSPDGGVDGATGSQLGPTRVSGAVSVSWNGARFLGAAAQTSPTAMALMRWENGASIDPTPLTVSTVNHIMAIGSGSDGRGRTVLVNQRFDSSPTAQSQRLFLNVVEDLLNGEPCSSAAACHSGFCADGVCCNTACAGGANDCTACSVAAGAALDGTCGPSTGNACSDQNACTQVDTCASGSCVGAMPVSCPPPGECDATNVCATATGLCVTTHKPDGTACSLGLCRAGTCTAVGDSGVGGGAGGAGGSAGGAGGAAGAGGGTAGSGGAQGGAGGGTDTGTTPSGCGCSSTPNFAGLALLALLRRRAARRAALRLAAGA